MRFLPYVRSVAGKWFHRAQLDDEIEEEIRSHIQHRADDLERSGLDRSEAERRARIEFGGHQRFKEECDEAVGGSFIETVGRDVHFSLRVLSKSPGFTAVAVLTLAVAICANSVVFGILNAFILRPLNVPEASTLYSTQRTTDGYGAEAYPTYIDLRDRNRSFDGLAAYTVDTAGLDTGDNPARVWLELVSGNYFDVLRLHPHLGRFFHASDEKGPNSAPYIVLTYGFWHSHFQDDPGVIGRVVRVNKHPFTVVGVAPRDFHGTLLFLYPDFFLPMVNQEQVNGTSFLNARANRAVFQIMGHLKPGVTPEQASADINSIGDWVEKTYSKEVGNLSYALGRPTFNGDFLGRPIRAFLAGLMLLAALILLAACANLGALFAARAADRGREVALRLALGAGRGRVLRQLLTEAVMISLMGGAVGLAGSIALLRALSDWQPLSRFPIHVPVHADGRVYVMAFLLAVVSGILFGLVPTRQVHRIDPYQIIKAGPALTMGRRIAARDLLLVVQVAICALLVTASMVAVRGLERSLHGRVGFEPRNAMLANTVLAMAGYRGEAVPAMQKRMLEAMQTVPGVRSAAITSAPPLDQAWSTTTIYTDETTDLRPANAAARPFVFKISPEYLQTAGTALLSGRNITWHDGANAPRVAVVNQEFARKIFGSEANAMGRHYKLRDGARIQVVGIVETGKYMNLAEDPKPAMFLPILQSPETDTWLIVRSERDPQELGSAIRQKLRELDPALPAFIVTWEQDLEGALFASRVATVALGVMGLLGAVLAVTGIFGMAAYSVSKRLRELGIRIALGAQRADVLNAGLGRALQLLAIGSAAGLLLGVLFSRVLAAIVYQATPRDPFVFAGVIVSMLFVGLLATWIPAQRALSLSPVTLLREE